MNISDIIPPEFIVSGTTPVQICMEATGTYHFDAAVYLDHKKYIQVMVINPRIARKFAESLNRQDKTDSVDACVLAEYCARMEFVLWQKPRDEYIKLRGFSRHLASMTYHLVQLKNQLHATSSSEEYGQKEIIRSLKTLIKMHESQIAKVEESAVAFIKADQELVGFFDLLCSVKGIAMKSAIQLLGELLVLPKAMTKEQWVKHAGLNPTQYQSGTSVNRKPRISKAGNRHLRTALFMPALSAANRDPYVRGYYAHLIQDNGLKKVQALCAVMRKLLHAIHGMFESGHPYDNKRFYQKPYSGPIEV